MVMTVSVTGVPEIRTLGRSQGDSHAWQMLEDQFSQLPIRQAVAARKAADEARKVKDRAKNFKKWKRRQAKGAKR